LTFLTGYSISGMAAHLGGELSYHYGLRVDRNVVEREGPEEYSAVLEESELVQDGLRRIEVDGVGVLLSRSSGGEVCAIAATCNHMGGPLEQGERVGDTVVCPLHGSRFDLCSGKVIDGPAVFPQSRYETRVREGRIEVRAAAENIQRQVT
jgi:nitrite reductase/ring-hydroxylating ferredoxin subunit